MKLFLALIFKFYRQFGMVLFHLWTCYLLWGTHGDMAGLVSLPLVVVSELYYAWTIYETSGFNHDYIWIMLSFPISWIVSAFLLAESDADIPTPLD